MVKILSFELDLWPWNDLESEFSLPGKLIQMRYDRIWWNSHLQWMKKSSFWPWNDLELTFLISSMPFMKLIGQNSNHHNDKYIVRKLHFYGWAIFKVTCIVPYYTVIDDKEGNMLGSWKFAVCRSCRQDYKIRHVLIILHSTSCLKI